MAASQLGRTTSCAENEKKAIPDNRNEPGALCPALRDLADLLADIALKRLKNTDQPSLEWPGETP